MPMNPRLLVPRATFDPDAAAYLRAVEAADGQALETPVKRAVDDFFKGCKADGTFSALKAACLLCGARTLAGALVPLAGTAPTNNNFVDADYNRETGLVGDGSTKYLDSGRAGNADGQDDVHVSRYATASGTSPTFEVHIGTRGSPVLATTQIGYSATGGFNFLSARSELQRVDVYGPQYTGFAGAARFASDELIIRINGSTQSGPSTSEAPPSFPYYVLARNSGGSTNGQSNARLAFYSIGESLDLALLDARVSALVTAIGDAL
jgi:hypothetical protein